MWTHAALVRRQLALAAWDEVAPTHQAIPNGFIEIDLHHVLTIASHRRGTHDVGWTYVRIVPRAFGVARRLAPDVAIPERETEERCAGEVPSWAASYFRLGVQWLLRLHAHTPVACWTDTRASAQASQTHPGSRAICTVFAAPPGHVSDYVLRVEQRHSALPSICVRIERERERIVVECGADHLPAATTVALADAGRASCGTPHDPWLLPYAVELQQRVDAVRAAMQVPPTPPSPAPLTPARRTRLHALEREWYLAQPRTRRPF